jgi:hypothetical protein
VLVQAACHSCDAVEERSETTLAPGLTSAVLKRHVVYCRVGMYKDL